VVRADARPPYQGAGLSAGFDILVPGHLSRHARRSLGVEERDPGIDRRGYYALIILAALAVVVFLLALFQRAG
jgi:hypothetical protein